ncbi:MAG: hypothetical protein JOZ41_22240 [Chloroflexi bacterium]|nr:hypothetical protein [Chloroflexota bacterium]
MAPFTRNGTGAAQVCGILGQPCNVSTPCCSGLACNNGFCVNCCPTGSATCTPCADPAQSCVNGVCTCPAGTTLCGSTCCRTGTGFVCVNGACVCPAGQTLCGSVCCPMGTRCSNGTCVCPDGRLPCTETCCFPLDHVTVSATLPTYNCCVHGSLLIRRAALVEIGGYHAEFPVCEDYDMCLRMAERFRLANLPEVLYLYRRSGSSTTSRLAPLMGHYMDAARGLARQRRAGGKDVLLAGITLR